MNLPNTNANTNVHADRPGDGRPSTEHGARAGIRVLTGDRPTGPLHLGHYFGTLANRVRLQSEGAELLVVVADSQVITDRDLPANLDQLTTGLVLDYLSCGLDPDATTIFAHSCVPALNQLIRPFLSLVSTSELERNPTVKEGSACPDDPQSAV